MYVIPREYSPISIQYSCYSLTSYKLYKVLVMRYTYQYSHITAIINAYILICYFPHIFFFFWTVFCFETNDKVPMCLTPLAAPAPLVGFCLGTCGQRNNFPILMFDAHSVSVFFLILLFLHLRDRHDQKQSISKFILIRQRSDGLLFFSITLSLTAGGLIIKEYSVWCLIISPAVKLGVPLKTKSPSVHCVT